MNVILASGSPRRKELMETFCLDNLTIIPAKGEEAAHPELAPDALVKELSRCKAAEVAALHAGPDDVVIGADTIVVLDGTVLGKPRDEADARKMLSSLSGRVHTVFTGITAIRGNTVLSHAERTEVHFRPLSEDEIDRYIATREPMDKAGGYAIQGVGAKFIERIEGDYYNVVGLPVCRLLLMLRELGIDI